MADLAKIQFLRSTVAGKTPTTSQLADGELAINMADYAIYTKNGSSIVQLAGKGIPETNTKKLTVNGPSALNDTVTVAEGKTITFTNADLSGGMVRHITGKNALNDGWYIGSGGESNKGFLEIGTIDDGDEEIRFVSRGSGDTVRRTLKLIDSGGNTRVPGNIYIDEAMGGGGSAFISKNKAYFGAGGADIYMRNTAGGATNQLTITDGGELLFQAKPVYWDGRKPTLTELGIGLVENARQLKQDNFPVTTGVEDRWTKVALLKDPGSSQSRLQLMVTNGGNYGSTRSSIDFIDCSARSFPTSLTSNNIRTYLQVRRLGDPALVDTNQLRYSLVRTSEGLELWFTQRAFIGDVKVALLSIAGGTEYYLPTGYTTSATAPEGLVESVAIRIYDEMNKPNLDDGTHGILSVAKGGTGASTADAARTNLGAVARAGDTMTGNLTINANLKVENPNGTMVDLGSENSDKYSRLTLARKVGAGAAVAMLNVTPEGHVQFGYQDTVATPSPSKYILVKSNGLEVEGDLVFNQTYRGTEEAVDITDKTVDLNGLIIKRTDPGTRQMYKCFSSGGSNISNKPTSDGNFVLEVLSLRKISDTNWTCKQTFTTKGNVEGTYVRYCQNGTWSAWKEVVAGVQPINLGGTGATSVAAARNNLGVGEGQTVSFGNLVTNDLTANGNARLVGRLNFGSTSATGVLRANETGAVVLGSASGQNIHIRAGSADTSNGETRFEPNGNVLVGGALTSSGSLQVNGEAAMSRSLIVSQNIKNTNDNSFILMGKDSDLGFVKKSNSGSKLVFASGKSFVVAKSSATAIANPASETYTDVFKVDADGNQTVYGNSAVSRALTVSSTATINGVINANGGIIVPTAKYVQIADAPTQNNQATNKKYVDDKVASAISNAGDTYLPLAGGTVTGRLTITGDQLKTTSLWVTGDTAVNGALTVDGNVVSNYGIGSFVGAVDVKAPAADNGTTHLWFRHSNGGERGVIYMPRDNNTMMGLRAGGSEWQLDGPTGQMLGPGARWRIHSDGNLQGDVYGGYITNYINDRFNQCAQWVRTGAQQDFGPIGRPAPGKTVPAGWVLVGLNGNSNEANQNMQLIGGRLQVWKPGVQWVDSAT